MGMMCACATMVLLIIVIVVDILMIRLLWTMVRASGQASDSDWTISAFTIIASTRR